MHCTRILLDSWPVRNVLVGETYGWGKRDQREREEERKKGTLCTTEDTTDIVLVWNGGHYLEFPVGLDICYGDDNNGR